MGRKATEESIKVKAFARAHGCSERWARAQRAARTKEWEEFSADLIVTPDLVAEDVKDDMERAEVACAEAWRTYRGITALVNKALNDPTKQDVLPAMTRSAREAHRAWQAAVTHRDELKRDAGLLVPVAKIRELAHLIQPLGELIGGLEVNVAGRMKPETRHEFYQAFDASRAKWNASVRELDRAIENLLPC